MTQARSEDFDKLFKLSSQLYAALMISAEEEFPQWPPEIRNAYMWLLTDISREVRDTLRGIQNTEYMPERKRA
jgi:hypothetical protein